MPISQSAKKALRVNRRQTEINRRRKTVVRSAIKTVSLETLSRTVSLIDKAAKWGIFNKNKAARLKSNLSKKFAAAPAPASEKPKKSTEKTAAPKKAAASKKTTKSASARKPATPKAKK